LRVIINRIDRGRCQGCRSFRCRISETNLRTTVTHRISRNRSLSRMRAGRRAMSWSLLNTPRATSSSFLMMNRLTSIAGMRSREKRSQHPKRTFLHSIFIICSDHDQRIRLSLAVLGTLRRKAKSSFRRRPEPFGFCVVGLLESRGAPAFAGATKRLIQCQLPHICELFERRAFLNSPPPLRAFAPSREPLAPSRRAARPDWSHAKPRSDRDCFPASPRAFTLAD
jgi:hypothetical protein